MEVFFYGLFMDIHVLAKNGINPSNLRMGYLKDYALRIGDRASLIPHPGEKSFGLVMTVNDEEIDKLYEVESVADYIPEKVNIIMEKNKSVTATCYNLPASSLTGTNESYALSLFKLAIKLGFPDDYLEKIKKIATTTPNKE